MIEGESRQGFVSGGSQCLQGTEVQMVLIQFFVGQVFMMRRIKVSQCLQGTEVQVFMMRRIKVEDFTR